jgi:hypothetical protein
MMKFLSRLRRAAEQESVQWVLSEVMPGVRFAIRLPSLLQRMELTKRLQELMQKYEFLTGGSDADHLQQTMIDLLVQKLLLEWGLFKVEGLRIDGKEADVKLLIEKGAEALVAEIIQKIRHACSLSEEERKNS